MAEKGDKINCNFIGKVNGVAFEGGTAEQFNFELGAGRMLPEFEAAATGIKAGETKLFDLTFPDDYSGEEIKGKTAQFELTALSIETPILPELDADFAKLMGFEDGNVEKLKTDVKANLEREVKGRMYARSKQAALDSMLTNTNFDAPKSLINDECAAQKEQFKEQMKRQGMTENMPDLPLDAFIEQSTKRVKLGLALGELITQNKLQVKPEQVSQRIDEISASYQKPEEVAAWYFGSRERLQEIEAVVLEDNAVEWLLNNCAVTTTVVPFEEVMAA
jgi:trigger factor